MKRLIAGLVLLLAAASCSQETSRTEGKDASKVVVFGTIEENALLPEIADFENRNPGVEVQYVRFNGLALYNSVVSSSQGAAGPDVVISSAMDLQVKLVNDGLASTYKSPETESIPEWARWRDQLFSVTFEPVVMVFNKDLMRGRKLPRTRAEFADQIRKNPTFWKGRIGLYDVHESSAGYLMFSQDARQGSDFGSFISTVGSTRPFTSGSTQKLFARLAKGELAAGYNFLGTYAMRAIKSGANLEVVYPQDYTLALSRTILIPRNARHPNLAGKFVDHLLGRRGQAMLANESGLMPIIPTGDRPNLAIQAAGANDGPLRPISLGPGLLTYLDRQKRLKLLSLFDVSIGRTQPLPETRLMAEEIALSPAQEER